MKRTMATLLLGVTIALGVSPAMAVQNDLKRAATAALDSTNGVENGSTTVPTGLRQALFTGSPSSFRITWKKVDGNYKLNWFVASDASTVIIAIRGSKDYENWLLNGVPFVKGDNKHVKATDTLALINGYPVRNWYGFKGRMVHLGWAKGANYLFSKVVPILKQQRAKGKRFIITGHSLGGALAVYLTYRLLNDTDYLNNYKSHRLITFGAPHCSGQFGRYGNSFAAGFLQNLWLKAPNLKVTAVETYNSKEVGVKPDPVTLIWSWEEAIVKKLGLSSLMRQLPGAPIVRRLGTVKRYYTSKKLFGKHDSDLYLDSVKADRSAPPTGWPAYRGILAFEDDYGYNGSGDFWVVTPGVYSNKGEGKKTFFGAKISKLRVPNDEVRAVVVPAGMTVYMTDDDHFRPGKHGTVMIKGPARVNIKSKNSRLPGKVSSMVVGARSRTASSSDPTSGWYNNFFPASSRCERDFIYAYEDDSGWTGRGSQWSVSLGSYSNKGRGGYRRLTVPNDEVRAVWVPDGLKVYMTDDDSFKPGKHGTVTIVGPARINIKAKNSKLPGKVSSIRVSRN